MHRVRAGDQVVVGSDGVRVHAPADARDTQVFEFMASEVSSEKPKALLVAQVADRLRAAARAGRRILVVCGPAVVHTGGRPTWPGWSTPAGSTCSSPATGSPPTTSRPTCSGTSLGVSVAEGVPTEGGHANHIRVINEVRRHGSIAAAVEAGFVAGGVMHACVRRGCRSCSAGRSATTARCPT